MVKCAECGGSARGKFCIHCGQGLPPHCLNCGVPTESDVKSCEKCLSEGSNAKSKKESLSPTSSQVLAQGFVWKKDKRLGKGSFGTVFSGFASNFAVIAVKLIDIGDKSVQPSLLKQLGLEIRALSHLKHPNIVHYLGGYWNTEMDTFEVYMEFINGNTLTHLFHHQGIDEKKIPRYTFGILQGLSYLHYNKIIHHNLKGDNVFIMEDDVVKLADYGCYQSCKQVSRSHRIQSTIENPYGLPPEIIVDEAAFRNYGIKADIWAFGCTILEMYTGKPPWPSFPSAWAAVKHMTNPQNQPVLPETLSSEAASFLSSCLSRDPGSRPTCAELLRHPFVPICDS